MWVVLREGLLGFTNVPCPWPQAALTYMRLHPQEGHCQAQLLHVFSLTCSVFVWLYYSGIIFPSFIKVWLFEGKWSPKRQTLLEDVSFLEMVWSCRRECVTVEAGFEISCMLKIGPSVSDFLLPASQDARHSATSVTPCLPVHYHVSPWW